MRFPEWQTMITYRRHYTTTPSFTHLDVMSWKRFPYYWTFVRRIHPSPMDSLHKDLLCGAFIVLPFLILMSCGSVIQNDMALMWRHCYIQTVVTYRRPYATASSFKHIQITSHCCGVVALCGDCGDEWDASNLRQPDLKIRNIASVSINLAFIQGIKWKRIVNFVWLYLLR